MVMRAWLGPLGPPVLPSRQHPAEPASAFLPAERSCRFPSFARNTHFREIGAFSRCGRAHLTPCPPPLCIPPRPNSTSPAREHPPGARPQSPGRLPRTRPPPWRREDPAGDTPDLLVGFEGKELCSGRQLEASGATAVSPRGAARGRGGGGGLLLGRSPSLHRARPHEGAEGLAAPRGSRQAGLVPSTAFARSPPPACPAPPPAGGVLGSGLRGQPGRQSGMKDDFLNCISVRGLSGLMS